MFSAEESAVRDKFAGLIITPEIVRRVEFQNTLFEVVDTSRKFIADRISKIRKDEDSLLQTMKENRHTDAYSTNGILIFHTIPLLDYRGGIIFDLSKVQSQISDLKFLNRNPLQYFDRLSDRLVYYDKFTTYTNIFAHGSIESTTNHLYFKIGENGGSQLTSNVIFPLELIPMLNNALNSHLTLSKNLGASVPIYVQITLLNLDKVSIFRKNGHSSFQNEPGKTISSEKIELEGTFITDYEKSREQLTRQLNLIWNVFGMNKCNYIDANGNFTIELGY